jgi:uncharacterized protein (DUF1501 family)
MSTGKRVPDRMKSVRAENAGTCRGTGTALNASVRRPHINNWDTHVDNAGSLKNRLLPPFDRVLSSFPEDLSARGLLEQTLVLVVGEFGRTPRIGKSSVNDPAQRTGRVHWADDFSALFAGAGVVGGQAIGRSDNIAAYPATRGYYPCWRSGIGMRRRMYSRWRPVSKIWGIERSLSSLAKRSR